MHSDLESVGAAPSAAAGRESVLYKVTALPEQAEAALAAAVETALSPKLTNYIVHDVEAAVKQDLEAFAADAKLQLTEVRKRGGPCLCVCVWWESVGLGSGLALYQSLTPNGSHRS